MQDDDNMDEFKEFMRNPTRDRIMIAGIIILGIAIFGGVLIGSLYLAHEATDAVTQGFGLPHTPHE